MNKVMTKGKFSRKVKKYGAKKTQNDVGKGGMNSSLERNSPVFVDSLPERQFDNDTIFNESTNNSVASSETAPTHQTHVTTKMDQPLSSPGGNEAMKTMKRLRTEISEKDDTIRFLLTQIQAKEEEHNTTLVELQNMKDHLERKEMEFEESLEQYKSRVFVAINTCNDDAKQASKMMAILKTEKEKALMETSTLKEKIDTLTQTINANEKERAEHLKLEDTDKINLQKKDDELFQMRQDLRTALQCHEMDVMRLEEQLVHCEKEKASALDDSLFLRTQLTRLQASLFQEEPQPWWQRFFDRLSCRSPHR